MMLRIGMDLIEIDRIAAALDRRPGFRERCFTEAEQAYCDSRPNPAQHYAARFAGKERRISSVSETGLMSPPGGRSALPGRSLSSLAKWSLAPKNTGGIV